VTRARMAVYALMGLTLSSVIVISGTQATRVKQVHQKTTFTVSTVSFDFNFLHASCVEHV